MSTDDRTPSRDEGRTVATDADEAPGATSTPAASASDVPPSPTPRADRPSPEEPTAEEPAPEDPAGASPPPWRRVPETDGAREAEHVTVADSLLSEAPTAFLTSPGAGAAAGGATATAVQEPEHRDSGAETPRPAVRNRPPRQALLQLKRLDPWSVLKMALALAVVLWLVWMVAAGVLYGVLGGMGVWDRLNGTYADLVTGQQDTSGTLISAGRVFGLAAVVGAINSLLFAVAMTIVAFVYNVTADLVGGVEVTLSERD